VVVAHTGVGDSAGSGVSDLGDVLADSVIRPLTNPVTNEPALVALRGNLAPDGAILKTAAARPTCSPTPVRPSCYTATPT
jgi:dihydroxyacid dehydratase/phosphogluconate dehydratase